MLEVELPAEMEERLASLATRTGKSKAFYIREALAQYLDDLEDIDAADTVYKRVLEGKEKIFSEEEVRKDLGLDS